MDATTEDYVAFWHTIHRSLSGGLSLLDALERAGREAAGTPLGEVPEQLAESILTGDRLSDALERRPELFSRATWTMVRAGEAGGVLDVICRRIADAFEDGTFLPAGAQPDPETEAPRYWRAFGWMLSSGVPMIEVLSILEAAADSEERKKATAGLLDGLRDGEALSRAMESFPDVFPAAVRAAVGVAEAQGDLDACAFRIADALESGNLEGLPGPGPVADELPEERPAVVEAIESILRDALHQRASDIHLEPTEDGRGRVRFRIDGVLHDIEPLPEGVYVYGQVISRIKLMAALDVIERRLPQDGRIRLELEGKDLDLRVCVVPTAFGERVVIRLLVRQAVPLDLAGLGFSEPDLETVRRLAHLPNGIVVVTGPAGCGKATLMYSMLREMDRDSQCVLSVEDPVQYHIGRVGQIQVRPQFGLTFGAALRSVLRQDPDVVMVNEIRDMETVRLCVQTGMTGHLVITSLHASTAPGAIRRLMDMGLEPFLVNSTLAAVIAPRLARVLCDECKTPAEPPLHSIPDEAAVFVKEHPDATFYEPAGCDACNGTGYRGRTGVYEILEMNDRIREVVHPSPDLENIRAAAASGMKPMLIDGMEKAARGITSIGEVCRVTWS
ncbi:MAG: ATPase, T2SS/T4P/T4SS family [Planctomycetota bacterium]